MQSYYAQLISLVLLMILISCAVSQDDDRFVGWNKANGLWGKRSSLDNQVYNNQQKRPENWAKLNTLWGKRSSPDQLNYFFDKRGQWQMANGLWGR